MTANTNPVSGRNERFEREVMPYSRALHQAALCLTHSKPDAEDLVQDALTKALTSLGQFKPGTNMHAWLCRILRTTFINSCRKRVSQPPADPYAEMDDVCSRPDVASQHAKSAEAEAIEHLSASPVMRAMHELREGPRAVIYLADVEGYSCRDVAEIMDIPAGTVASQLSRGRAKLRSALASEAAQPPRNQ